MGFYDEWWDKQRQRKQENYDGLTEKCHYCGCVYHPMPCWGNGDTFIFVCSDAHEFWKLLGKAEPTQCAIKALCDGYTKRKE